MTILINLFCCIIGGLLGAFLMSNAFLAANERNKRELLKESLTPNNLIYSLVISYEYNRSDAHMIMLIMNVLSRIKQLDKTEYDTDDFKDVKEDADIFTGILNIYYGDYGTSPRYGWLKRQYKDAVIKSIEDELKDYIGSVKIDLEMESDKYSEEEAQQLGNLVIEAGLWLLKIESQK